MRMPRAYDHVSQTVHDFDACFFFHACQFLSNAFMPV